MKEYPDASVVTLKCNYRSTNTILSASFQVINTDGVERSRTYSIIDGVKTIAILELANEHAEAESIAHVIEVWWGEPVFTRLTPVGSRRLILHRD